jgi:hypothetical protein
MKAILEFNLDEHDDAMAHNRAVQSLEMALFIWDLSAKIRELTDTSEDGKYIDEKHIWEAWEELTEKYNLNIDKLIY